VALAKIKSEATNKWRDNKLPSTKLENHETGKPRNWKTTKLENHKTGKPQNWKTTKLARQDAKDFVIGGKSSHAVL
jgi:hypothetical protein